MIHILTIWLALAMPCWADWSIPPTDTVPGKIDPRLMRDVTDTAAALVKLYKRHGGYHPQCFEGLLQGVLASYDALERANKDSARFFYSTYKAHPLVLARISRGAFVPTSYELNRIAASEAVLMWADALEVMECVSANNYFQGRHP